MIGPKDEIVTEFITVTIAEQLDFVRHTYRLRFILDALAVVAGVLVMAYAESRFKVLGGGIVGGGIGDYVYLHWHVRRAYADPKNKTLRDPTRARITEDKIVLESQGGIVSELPWASLRSITQHKGNFYLTVSTWSSIIMLQRAQSPEDWARFSAWAEAWRSRLG